jgi:hypothetical protein
MADISNVINVSLLAEGRTASRDNLNNVMLITSEVGVLSTAERYRIYTAIGDVASDFGTESQAYDFAQAFFGTSPNSVNAGGALYIGFWRAVQEDVAASAAVLSGAELSEAVTIGLVQNISDGTMDIDVDGVTESLAGLDFRTSTTLEDVVTELNAALAGATASLSDTQILITSDTTGVLSLITLATDPAAGTFVGSILGLAAGTGAVATQGADASVIALETKEAAIAELKAQTNMYGAMFIDEPTSVEAKDLAEWAQANDTLVYDVFDTAANLEIDPTNVVWDIKLSSLTNYRMLYSAAGNRKFAAAYMARTHTVNFNAENSALTMHLKELPVTAEEYSQTDITKAKNVGLDIYTTIKQTPVILTSGANDFTDNRYNLIGYQDAIETDLFNLLKLTSTKIPQTTRGVNQLIDQCEKTTRGFVRAGVFAPGTWSSPDYFGDKDTFDRNILEAGFYFLAGRLSDQPQADRQARKSPVIQGAVKNAGAIHSADIIINFNA